MENNISIKPWIAISLILIIFWGCKDQNTTVPHSGDMFTLYNIAADPDYQNLINVNGHVYVTGGFNRNGILIYRVKYEEAIDDFVVYDRTCPYEITSCSIDMDEMYGFSASCECCGSKFNMVTGAIEQGPATHYLSRFRCDYIDGSLHVY